MKTWAKFLVVGWSIVCIGIVAVSYQVMKKDYVDDSYKIFLPFRTPEDMGGGVKRLANWLYANEDEQYLSKEQFIERAKGARALDLQSEHKVKNRAIYLYLPIYSFAIWALPLLVFVILGHLFAKDSKAMESEMGHGDTR
jgi:hypothetical protein